MTPADVEELSDEMWAAMVRRIQREADAIQQSNTKLPTQVR